MDIKDLSNKIREIIKDFECNVYLFGSRVKGNYRKDSDLDIAVFNSTGLKFLKIEEALENSNIPYSMDNAEKNPLLRIWGWGKKHASIPAIARNRACGVRRPQKRRSRTGKGN